jgi:hypothetical protein
MVCKEDAIIRGQINPLHRPDARDKPVAFHPPNVCTQNQCHSRYLTTYFITGKPDVLEMAKTASTEEESKGN